MKRKIILLVLVLAGRLCVQGQSGNYFLSNYNPSDERIDYLTFAMVQDDRGVVYFANKSNVLEFDGRNWTPIPTPGPVYTICALNRDIFVGGLNGYGKIIRGESNEQTYQNLSQNQPAARQIISSFATKDKIYFLSQHAVFIVVAATGITDATIKSGQDTFNGLFEIDGKVYVGTENHGQQRIDNKALESVRFGLPDNSPLMFCSALAGTNKVIVGNIANRIYIHDFGTGFKEINIKDAAFLESNVMVNGVWVNEKLIAIGTLRGGVIFINPQTGVTEEIVNFQTGLPDNEVYALLSDKNQGVWVAHDYGYTRIAPYLPFRSFSHYPGLSGNLLCARVFKDQTYVGTTLGLFNLTREEVYENETYEIAAKEKTTFREGFSKSVGGLFSIFRKDKNKKKATTQISAAKPKLKATRKVLKALRYVYRKVDGVEGKVNQLTEVHGKLLASGITGVLEVEGLRSRVITTDPVRSVFLSSSLDQLLVSTLDQEVKSFESGTKGWVETHLLDTLQEDVNYIFEDKLQNIWLCGRTNVFKVETVDNAITDVSNIPFSNPSLDEPVGVAYGSEVYVAASGEINRYDFRGEKFVSFHSLSGSKKYFASAGYFWFFDGHYWLTVDKVLDNELKLKWLGLFRNIRFLAPVGHGNGLWVITAANELYRFSPGNAEMESSKYPLFLREVRGEQNHIAPAAVVNVNQVESTVSFDFIQPNYFGNRAMEYRYKVTGLNKDWTEYSVNNNVVPFSYLPTGKYKVEIQTRDMLGVESPVAQIQMRVIPPYWKQWWFYASEFAFFSILVIMSIRLSAVDSKYRYISDLLSVLTVIMLIQFIQTIAQSQISIKSTPVLDFFVQVMIALLVLPIETYLRKFMSKPSIMNILPGKRQD